MSMNINVNSLNKAKGSIKILRTRLNNPKPAFKQIGSYISMYNKKVFATNGAFGGKPWKPLKPDYMQWKVRSGYPKNILVRTGKLRRSYTSRPMNIEVYLKNKARYGTKIKYAGYHQSGTSNMPARPVLRDNKKMKEDIGKIVLNYLTGKTTNIRGMVK